MNNTTSENHTRAIRKPPNILDKWDGYPEIFNFSQALEISRQYILLWTVILRKKVPGCMPLTQFGVFFFFYEKLGNFEPPW